MSSARSISQTLASLAADALVPLYRAQRPISTAVWRLLRLARLRSVTAGVVPISTQFDGPVQTVGRPRLHLGPRCRLGRDVFFETQDEGRIEIGADVRINRGCLLVSYSRISIGSDCLIGEYVSIRDADHGMCPGQPMRLQPHAARPITIGDDVWIARGAVILSGVSVGSGAVVGANSVVTKDVPPLTIVAGVPARVLRRRDTRGPVLSKPAVSDPQAEAS